MIPAQSCEVFQPLIERFLDVMILCVECGADTSTFGVSHDDNVVDLDVVNGIYEDRLGAKVIQMELTVQTECQYLGSVEKGEVNELCDISVDKDMSKARTSDDRLGYSRV